MLSLILLQQIAQLFIIIFLGWAIVKAGILKSEDSRVLSMLLLYVIIPCVILNAFQIERTTDTVRMMELSLLSALMMNVLSLVLGRLSAKLFCLNTVETASVMYSNCTNMVVPLVIGIWGEDWVMYVTCYSIVQTILVWTHARILISGKKEISLRDLVCNVNILAIAIGLFLFAFQIRLPAVIRSAFAMAGNTMGPVAMLIIGMLMADMDMQHLRSYRQLWKPVLLRLIVLPVILVCVAKYSGLAALAFMHFGIGRDLATVLIKAILFSLLSVFTLMPGLLVLFSKLIDKTRHKNLVPKITAVGKFDVKTRFVIPPIFGVIIVAAAVFANLCPYCYTYTDLVTAVEKTKGTNIHVGAENVHFEKSGAFTGEISADMLVDLGVEYVIVGHSERRQYFAETDQTVNKRALAALNAGLKVIICVGESLQQREEGVTEELVRMQTKIALRDVTAEQMANVVIAYEPIWAIGTGKTATADQAEEVCGQIRKVIGEVYGEAVAEATTIQYGGSMNAKNCEELLSKKDVDGGLIGGASLKAPDFAVIVNAATKG